jgi:lysine-arginine-ornithine-binding protein
MCRQTLLAIFLLLGGISFASAQEKVIKVGTEGDYPRFSYTDTAGNLAGWDIDIVKAVCEEAKLKCEFVRQSFDGMIPALLAGKIDMISSINVTDERKKAIAFSDKHYNIPYRWVAKRTAGLEPTKDGLKGKVIGVQSGTIQENYVRDNFGDVAKIQLYKNQDEANLDLIAGRIDATIAQALVIQEGLLDKPEGKEFAAVGPEIADVKWFGEGTAFGLRKDDKELRDTINRALAAVIANGTYKSINQKHFPIDIYGPR